MLCNEMICDEMLGHCDRKSKNEIIKTHLELNGKAILARDSIKHDEKLCNLRVKTTSLCEMKM